MMNRLKDLSPYQLFALDGVGALFTASLLLFVLRPFESFFGMPEEVLTWLGGLAVLFALYSFSCSLLRPKRWSPYLLLIAIANLLYCVTTAATMIVVRDQLTVFGVMYFVGEIALVVLLAICEVRVANLKS